MPPVPVLCSRCGASVVVPPRLAGKPVACPKCKQPLRPPAPAPVPFRTPWQLLAKVAAVAGLLGLVAGLMLGGVLVRALSPAASSQPSGPGVAETAVPADEKLTDEQKAAWLKLRRANARKESPYYVAGYVVSAKEWRMWAFSLNAQWHWRWQSGLGTPLPTDIFKYPGKGLEWATALAKDRAADPGVKACVVLDLFTGDRPVIAAWCFDEGNGAKVGTAAPSPEMQQSATAYLLYLQQHATDLDD